MGLLATQWAERTGAEAASAARAAPVAQANRTPAAGPLRILLSGHACAPHLGSEPSFTWNWATRLAEHHEVWVLTHPHYRDVIEQTSQSRNPNLHFVWVTLPRWLDPWNPARGERGLRLHYFLWQRAALRAARRLHEQVHFDVAHHVSWVTFRAPSLLWKLPIPFVFGPIGSGQIAPRAFRRYFDGDWPREHVRNMLIGATPLNPVIRAAFRHSALVLATNRETEHLARRMGARRVQLLADAGVQPRDLGPARVRAGGPLQLLWVGRLESRKGLPLALEALALLGGERVHLLVAGGGPRRAAWEARTRELKIQDQVTFLGQVPFEEMSELYAGADAFIFTSLRDSCGTVLFEALSHARAVIVLDHQGAGALIASAACMKVPVTTPQETVRGLADAIGELRDNPSLCQALGAAGQDFVRAHLQWDARVRQMNLWYREVIDAHRGL